MKSDKELAVELTAAIITSFPQSLSAKIVENEETGRNEIAIDVYTILQSAYDAVVKLGK